MITKEQQASELLKELVAHGERELGSKMKAYTSVSDAIGKSGTWLRRFLAGSPEANLTDATHARICRLYGVEVARWAAEAVARRERFASMMQRTGVRVPPMGNV